MARNALILMLVSLLSGAVFLGLRENWELEARKQLLAEQMNQPVAVVFAIEDINEGSKFTSANVSLKELPACKLPARVVLDVQQAIGRRAKYGVERGQLLSQHDLDPRPPGISNRIER